MPPTPFLSGYGYSTQNDLTFKNRTANGSVAIDQENAGKPATTPALPTTPTTPEADSLNPSTSCIK